MASVDPTSTSSPSPDGPVLSADTAFDGFLPEVPQRLAAVLEGLAVGELRSHGASHAAQTRATPYTLLTLFTADGLLEALEWANAGQPADENACLWLAYLRWLRFQEAPWPEAAPSPLPRWFDATVKNSFPADAGARVTHQSLEALSTGAMGEVERPVLPEAQEPDVVLRSVALGLLPTGWKSVTAMTVNGAAITHGHPEAQVASVGAALMVQATATAALRGDPQPVRRALEATVEILPQVTRPGHTSVKALQAVFNSAQTHTHDDDAADLGTSVVSADTDGAESIDESGPGAGSVAADTLAAGISAALDRERHGGPVLAHSPALDPAVEALACALAGAAGGLTALTGAGRPSVPETLVEIVRQVAARWGEQLGVATSPSE